MFPIVIAVVVSWRTESLAVMTRFLVYPSERICGTVLHFQETDALTMASEGELWRRDVLRTQLAASKQYTENA